MVAEKGMISLNGEDVVSGWLSADQVAKAISVVQSAKTVNEIQTKFLSTPYTIKLVKVNSQNI